MRTLLAAAIASALFLVALTLPALAQETSISVPWGNAVVFVVNNFGEIILAVIGLLFARLLAILPKPVGDFLKTLRVEQILKRAVDFGIQATEGAAKDKTLTVDVGSEVVARALKYVLDHAPDKLIGWMGGVENIKEMILARLDLTANASAEPVLTGAEAVVIKSPV